jgi:phosphonoacetaldehyde hydrolase
MNLKTHFDLVIFDWAGTVVDFGCQAPVNALLEAFATEGVRLDEKTARRDMGKSKSDHVQALLSDAAVAALWRKSHGRAPLPGDLTVMMNRLEPLMRAQAAQASSLIPGALETLEGLRAAGIRVASSTGSTREMLGPVLASARAQGYVPEHVVCAGETPTGRPSPLMIYKACAELGIWPLSRVVKVDDAESGVAEGKAAGAFTVGVASGNALGLAREALQALPSDERRARIEEACARLKQAGADIAIESVAVLLPALQRAAALRLDCAAQSR